MDEKPFETEGAFDGVNSTEPPAGLLEERDLVFIKGLVEWKRTVKLKDFVELKRLVKLIRWVVWIRLLELKPLLKIKTMLRPNF
jgi:hypothetical protein